MAKSPRREKIEAMLADDPQDVFLRYSLAMEMASEGELEESLQVLQELRGEQPPHVPSFFRSAQHLVALDRIEEARTMLRDGIEHARTQGDAHAAGEMSELLEQLGAMGE